MSFLCSSSSIWKIARILKPWRDSEVLVKLIIKDPSASVNPVTNKGFKEGEICVGFSDAASSRDEFSTYLFVATWV